MGDAAHEGDEVALLHVGADRSGRAGVVEEGGAGRPEQALELRGPCQGVRGRGRHRCQGLVGDLRFERADQERLEPVPGVGVRQRLLPYAARASREGAATVSTSASVVGKCR